MSKYINADEYRKILNGESNERTYCINENAYDDGLDRGLGIAIDILDEMPAADVVEVVRCKDCKFYESFGNKDFHCGECLNVGYDSPTKTVPKDGFCYEAERKETK